VGQQYAADKLQATRNIERNARGLQKGFCVTLMDVPQS
jgi:hypothetical protein